MEHKDELSIRLERLSIAQRSMMKRQIYNLLAEHYQDEDFINNDK